MTLTLQVTPTTPSTTIPGGSVITITGSGSNAYARLPGARQDPADLYGMVLALVAIALAIVFARWMFGRTGGKPSQGGSPNL